MINFKLFFLFIIFFSWIDIVLVNFNYEEDNIELKEKKLPKKWELISNFVIVLIIFKIFSIIIYKTNYLGKILTFLMIIFFISMSLLNFIKILIGNIDKKISKNEFKSLLYFPIYFSLIFLFVLDNEKINIYMKNINIYLLLNTIKNFIYSFFTFALFFVFIKEFKKANDKKYIIIKKNNKKTFNIMYYEYNNCKNKKGIKFILGYFIDILTLLKDIIFFIINIYVYYLPKYLISFIYNFFKKITKGYNTRVIIIETFNLSIIFSLLRTYYSALKIYQQNYSLEFYSVIVTSILIPSILQILSNLFEDKQL